MSLVESWQDFAFKEDGYTAKPIYSIILSLLVRNGRQAELHLNGNQPSLRKQRLCDDDIAILLKSLSGQLIRFLDISYNRITDTGLNYISEFLKNVDCSIQYLDLSHNDLTPDGIQILADALQLNTSVTHLILDGNHLERKGGVQLAAMLQVNIKLMHLSIASTDLHTDCIIALSTVLHGNRTLKFLDISRPLLHSKLEESTIHISKMLKINYTLQELHLSKHGITDIGVEWICRNLRENSSLVHLDLSCNQLSRDGAHHLAKLLFTNPVLKILNLSSNHIEDEGMISLSQALSTINTNLQSLSVCSNSIKDKGLCALADALQSNTTLSEIYIWGNKWQTATCNAFRKILTERRLMERNTDVQFYEVDGVTYLARTVQHAL